MVPPAAPRLRGADPTASGREGFAAGVAVDEPEEAAKFTRWETDGAGQRVGVSSLQLAGMHCAACVGLIEQALRSVDGVVDARVNPGSRLATVRWRAARTRPSALIAAVQGAGYGAVPDIALEARALRRRELREVLWRLFVSAFLSMQVMMLATPAYVAQPDDLSADLARLLHWGQWVLSVPVLGFAGMPFLRGAWRSVRARRIGMDVPVGLGIAVAFLASTASTFDPDGIFGHEVYFDSLTMFLAFLWLGRWLELKARHRAAEALEATIDAMPLTATRVGADGQVDVVSIHRLRVGDRVRVPAGAGVPADGPLHSAQAHLSEAMLTGESTPVQRHRGEVLLAGSLNAGAPFEMVVERLGADTRHEAIVALMRETLSQRPAAARLADRWAGPFLWAVLALAVLAVAWWSALDPSRAVGVAVSVLIVTCPCALSLATPATLVASAGGLARRGVLLRRLEALEAMAAARHVCLDKTGTLTQDRLRWSDTTLAPDAGACGVSSGLQALGLAASLARWSHHPASQALVRAVGAEGAAATWSNVVEVPGAGVEGFDPLGRRWRLGAAPWAGGADRAPARVVLGCDGLAVAAFGLQEQLREDAAQVVTALRSEGLEVALLSGDEPRRASDLASQLGIDRAHGGLDPAGKQAVLRGIQASGAGVVMVGDGINDAPVLAAADVSLAMGHAALAARQGADAVVLGERLAGVVDLRRTARRTLRIMRQNLAWAVAYNASCVPLAMAGLLPPWAAGLGMAASSLLVILHAQRAGDAPVS